MRDSLVKVLSRKEWMSDSRSNFTDLAVEAGLLQDFVWNHSLKLRTRT
jgi:hypothetical protein